MDIVDKGFIENVELFQYERDYLIKKEKMLHNLQKRRISPPESRTLGMLCVICANEPLQVFS